MGETIQLKTVRWEDLKDAIDYLFRNGGVWQIGYYNKDRNYVSADEYYYNEDEVDGGILYELPESA
jgi:hypothetical protein